MNPLVKFKLLTQDLALYQDIHRLNYKLLNSDARSSFQQYDWEAVALDTDKIGKHNLKYNSEVLNRLTEDYYCPENHKLWV